MINRYSIAIVSILIILLCYYFFIFKVEKFTLKKSEKKTKNKKNIKNKKNSNKKTKKIKNTSSEDDPEEEEAVNEDAENLYNLVHEDLCKGIQKEKFEEKVGELADSMVFIKLKQLYNKCADKNLDPMNIISVQDYIKILKD